MSAILIFWPSSQKVSPSTTQVRRVTPQSSKRGEALPPTSESLGASSDEAVEVRPDIGQFNASIPPANTIENSARPNIHSLRTTRVVLLLQFVTEIEANDIVILRASIFFSSH